MAYDLDWLTEHVNTVTDSALTKTGVARLLKRLGFAVPDLFHGEIDRRVKLLVAHLRECPRVRPNSSFEDDLFENETPVGTSPVADQPPTEDPAQ